MNIIKPYEISVFFVPHWVTESLKRRGVSQDIFLEPVDKLIKYLSPNDIASCIALNRLMGKNILNTELDLDREFWYGEQSLPNTGTVKKQFMETNSFFNSWQWWKFKLSNADDKNNFQYNELFSTIDIMSSQPDVIESVKTRLFSSPDLK